MRNVSTKILTAGLLVLLASPAFAQPPGPPGGRFGFGGQGPNAAMLLRDDKVQEELKLTDDQKEQFKKIGEKFKDDIEKARNDKDFQKMGELFKSASEEVDKAVPTILKPEQVTRLKQLEVQAGGLNSLTKEDVQSELKLTDKQKKDIAEAKTEIDKDAADLFKDAQGDREKMREVGQKVRTMRTEAMTKILDSMTDDQKKEWKQLSGDKFEFSFGQRRPGGDEKPKDK